MEYRYLGKSGLQVSALSLGAWVTYGNQVGEDIAFECMDAAYRSGVNFFDNAEVYADGKAETVMGKVLKRTGWNASRRSLRISPTRFPITVKLTLSYIDPAAIKFAAGDSLTLPIPGSTGNSALL